MSIALVSLPCSSNEQLIGWVWIWLLSGGRKLQSTGLEVIWRVHLNFIKIYVILKCGKSKVTPVQDVEVIWWKGGRAPFICNFRTGWRWVRQKRQCNKPCFHYVLTQQEYCAYSLRISCITEVFYSSWSIFKWFSPITTIRRFGVPASRRE
jgi:hypothetical protein